MTCKEGGTPGHRILHVRLRLGHGAAVDQRPERYPLAVARPDLPIVRGAELRGAEVSGVLAAPLYPL